MKFRLIALASCVALGSIAFGGKAQAQPFTIATDVPMTSNGTVGLNCTVTTPPKAGIMVLDTPDILSSATGAGTALASFGLTCSSGASVVVQASTSTGAVPVPANATIVADLLEGATSVGISTNTIGGAATPSTSTPLTAAAGVPTTLNMSHIITTAAAAALPQGVYGVATIVTVTPQ